MDHGIPMTPYFYAWFIGIPAIFVNIACGFRLFDLWPEPARKGSRKSDIMAFQIIGFICVTYLGIAGAIAWFDLNSNWNFSTLSNDRINGHEQFVEDHLLMPMLSYQFWLIILCLVMNDLREISMIGHHVVTFGLSYVCLHPILGYFVCFYFGLAELTNIPLTVYDTFKYFPELKKTYPFASEIIKYIFVIGFYILRIGVWSHVTYNMISIDLYPLLQSGEAHSNIVMIFFLFAAAFLTGLQWLWGYKIAYIVYIDKFNTKKIE